MAKYTSKTLWWSAGITGAIGAFIGWSSMRTACMVAKNLPSLEGDGVQRNPNRRRYR